jgi:hypothetical protein
MLPDMILFEYLEKALTCMESAKCFSRIFVHTFRIILAVTILATSFPVVASVEKSNPGNEAEPLQTEISQRDIKIIEQLVAIAQRNSAQVQETKAAMGLGAFVDIMSVELSPSQSITNYTLPGVSSEEGQSFSLTITVDPLKLFSTISQMPLRQARWSEAKQQKRIAVVQHYLAYLQARQITKISAYRMHKLTEALSVASINYRVGSPRKVYHLSNPEYVAAATEMLSSNAREQLALEELAACIGLSPQATTDVINDR